MGFKEVKFIKKSILKNPLHKVYDRRIERDSFFISVCEIFISKVKILSIKAIFSTLPYFSKNPLFAHMISRVLVMQILSFYLGPLLPNFLKIFPIFLEFSEGIFMSSLILLLTKYSIISQIKVKI
jgi:hypothetical protein